MAYTVARAICAFFCYILFTPQVSGKGHVPKKGGFILACNHASYLDPVIFGVACPRALSYMARSTLFSNRFFGWLLKKGCRAFPVKRGAADVGALKEALKKLKDGEGLLLFPEGTRSLDGQLGKGHHGVGFLTRKSGVPVIPVYGKDTHIAFPKGSRSIKPMPIRIVFGEPMDFSRQENVSDQGIADAIMERLQILKDSLS
jgi:1-acyl-sn-glycerol-3-phosphate acyltransferase